MTYTHQHHKQLMSVLSLIAGMTMGIFFIQFGSPWIGFVAAVLSGVVSLAMLRYPVDERFGKPPRILNQRCKNE